MPSPSAGPFPVHWQQGMFLRPQHFQATDHYWQKAAQTACEWDHSFFWGLRALQLDEAALGNMTVKVTLVQARLRDGTLVEAEGAELPARTFDDAAFGGGHHLYLFLAVPELQSAGGNTPNAPGNNAPRYRVHRDKVEDLGAGGNPQDLEFLRQNVRLLVHHQPEPLDLQGYTYLRIARIDRSAEVNARPVLAERYIPPLLSCDAWPTLVVNVLQAIYHRMGKLIDLLAALFRDGRGLEGAGPVETRVYHQLGILNEGYALLHVLAFTPGLHPWTAYLELCRLAGRLAVLAPGCRLVSPAAPSVPARSGPSAVPDGRRGGSLPAELPPRYNHDKLGSCFYTIKELIDRLLDAIRPPRYEMAPFQVQGSQLFAAIKSEWVMRRWLLYIGVDSNLGPQECENLLCGGLDMKVGGTQAGVEHAFHMGGDTLTFARTEAPPVLMAAARRVYFQIEQTGETDALLRDALGQGKLWIYFNTTAIEEVGPGPEAGRPDQDLELRLRVNEGVQVIDFRSTFTLYAVPPEEVRVARGESGF